MRPRDHILSNLEQTYREQYEVARKSQQTHRMAELDAGYQRDQLMLEVLCDIRDLLASQPRLGKGA